MVKPCEICGDVGVPEAIVTCSRCKSTRVHLYCMRVVRTDVPQFWDCDECLGNKLVSPRSTITKQTPKASKKRVPTFMQKSPTVNEGRNKNVIPNRFNFKEKSVDTGRTKYISCDEVAKLSSGANKLKCSPRKEILSSHVIPRFMPPPRERTPVKSPQIEWDSKPKSVGKPLTGPKVTFCETPETSRRIETTSTERKPKKVNFAVPSPVTVETDVAMDVEVAKSSEILAKTGIQSVVINTEREPKKVNFEVPSPITVETDVAMDVEVVKSSEILAKTGIQSVVISTEREPKKVNFEVPSPITVDSDAMDVEVAKSSEILAKAGIQSATKMGSKNDADLGARSSDGEKPILPSPLAVCETFGPYIPALNSYWKGDFSLPHSYEKYNDAFLAHPPSKVHDKVYETIVNMPERIYFELAPNHDVYMELFSDSLPDTDDIGLYFFPRFSHRSEESMAIADFLWSKNLLMHSLVNGVELLVFSSKLLKPSLQEFEGNCYLWGVFRCQKNSKLVTEAPLLLEDKRERCDDAPPGFESLANASLLLKDKSKPCDDAPPGFESVAEARLLLEVNDEVCDDAPPGFERTRKPKSWIF